MYRRFTANVASWQRGVASLLLNASIWCLFYFFLLRTPLPRTWNVRAFTYGALGIAALGGALSRATSRRVWPIVLGATLGVALGAEEACVTDTLISIWQALWCGLGTLGFYSLYLWAAIILGWGMADRAAALRGGSRMTR